jgi:hypothetical protein
MDFIESGLFILAPIYFLLVLRGTIKLPTEKSQREFDERTRNKRWKNIFTTACYVVILLYAYKIVHTLYTSRS